ncbi:MAG: DUF5337 domain-containing protein [Roseobacter sp.]
MSAQTEDQQAAEQALAKKGRTVSLIIAGTMIAWLIVQFVVGPMLDLSTRFVILIDLCAMAALAWSFIVSWQIKRARKAALSTVTRDAARDDM